MKDAGLQGRRAYLGRGVGLPLSGWKKPSKEFVATGRLRPQALKWLDGGTLVPSEPEMRGTRIVRVP